MGGGQDDRGRERERERAGERERVIDILETDWNIHEEVEQMTSTPYPLSQFCRRRPQVRLPRLVACRAEMCCYHLFCRYRGKQLNQKHVLSKNCLVNQNSHR